MVGKRQLLSILSGLADWNCKVILLGDPDQLQPIEAGTPFRDIIARHEHATLTEVRRQQEAWQREASIALAQGNTRKALSNCHQGECVSDHTTADEAVSALASDYVADTENGVSGPTLLAMAHRRKDVFAVNQAIRAWFRASDNLDADVLIETECDPPAFAVADRIHFTRNKKTLGLRNGTLGTFEDVDCDHLTVHLDDGSQTITVDPRFYDAIDHG